LAFIRSSEKKKEKKKKEEGKKERKKETALRNRPHKALSPKNGAGRTSNLSGKKKERREKKEEGGGVRARPISRRSADFVRGGGGRGKGRGSPASSQ